MRKEGAAETQGEMANMRSFKKLIVWQRTMDAALNIFRQMDLGQWGIP